MESFSSFVSTEHSFDDIFSQNMWNSFLDLFFLEQTSGVFVLYVEEIELAKVALSCHVALDFSATKKVHMILHDATLRTVVRGVYLL